MPSEPGTGHSRAVLAAALAALGEEDVGLVEVDDGEWDIYFGPLRLGRFHEQTLLIEDALGRPYRRRY